MAILFPSKGSGWIFTLQVLLTSAAVLFMAVLMKTSVPAITEFFVYEVPSVYGFMLSWLRPPYLYVLINCIIISIVASNKLHQQRKVEEAEAPLVPLAVPPPLEPVKVSGDVRVEDYASYGGVTAPWSDTVYDETQGKKKKTFDPDFMFGGAEVDGALYTEAMKVNDDEVEVLRPVPMTMPERNDSTNFSFLNMNEKTEEKPLVSSRLPLRKSAKSSPEGGKALGVSKPKRHDTLESTWKAITDGRAMPLTRHLRKSDTLGDRLRRNDENTPPPPPRMKKSETFTDRSSSNQPPPLSRSPGGSGKLRREPSLGQDELNRRVEAFIKKFNEDMRLQRQESLNQYQEMIQRGAV